MELNEFINTVTAVRSRMLQQAQTYLRDTDDAEEELSAFVKEETPKPRNIKMWPWLAAACVAALLVIFLAPPRAPIPKRGSSKLLMRLKTP